MFLELRFWCTTPILCKNTMPCAICADQSCSVSLLSKERFMATSPTKVERSPNSAYELSCHTVPVSCSIHSPIKLQTFVWCIP